MTWGTTSPVCLHGTNVNHAPEAPTEWWAAPVHLPETFMRSSESTASTDTAPRSVARFTPRAASALLLGSVLLATLAACNSDSVSRPTESGLLVGGAFSAVPSGMDLAASSYGGDASADWEGPMRGPMRGMGGMGAFGGRGIHGGPGIDGLMGGGLRGDFRGDSAPSPRPHRGPFAIRIDSTCTVSGNDVNCTNVRNGLTTTNIFTITSKDGAAQTRIDSMTTNTVRTRTTVTGTTTRRVPSPGRDSASAPTITATVNASSDRTVTGLAAGSTQRTVNGWSKSAESISGTNRDGERFTAIRNATDTTKGLVVPAGTVAGPGYPTAGTVVRVISVQSAVNGGTPTTNERREVLTYNGSNTATLVITENGTTKTCSITLPRGRPSCS